MRSRLYLPAIKALNHYLKNEKLVYVVIFDDVNGRVVLKDEMRRSVERGTHLCVAFSVNKHSSRCSDDVVEIPLVPKRDLRNVYIEYIVNEFSRLHESSKSISLMFAGKFERRDFIDQSNRETKAFTIAPEVISTIHPYPPLTTKDTILKCFVQECGDVDVFCKQHDIARDQFSRWLSCGVDNDRTSAKVMTWLLIRNDIKQGKLSADSKPFRPEMRIHVHDLRTISLIDTWNHFWNKPTLEFCQQRRLHFEDFDRWVRVKNHNSQFESVIDDWIRESNLMSNYLEEESRNFQLCIA